MTNKDKMTTSSALVLFLFSILFLYLAVFQAYDDRYTQALSEQYRENMVLISDLSAEITNLKTSNEDHRRWLKGAEDRLEIVGKALQECEKSKGATQ